MDSTRPIRALTRGLDALTVLNVRNGATVSEVSSEIRLPRTTVYRILETLCNAGFAFRDSADDRYRLTIMVRGLSDGFTDEPWVAQVARPRIHALSRDIVWPVSVATLSGTSMLVRETTDHDSPLAVERYSAGFRTPLLSMAAGRAYLAFCPAAQREALLDALARSGKEEDKPARAPRPELTRMLSGIKSQGYATVTRTRRLSDEVSISVPAALPDRGPAVLTVRFATSAFPLKVGLERFLPKLRQCAASITAALSDQPAEATA